MYKVPQLRRSANESSSRCHVTCAGLGFRDLCYTVQFRGFRVGLRQRFYSRLLGG